MFNVISDTKGVQDPARAHEPGLGDVFLTHDNDKIVLRNGTTIGGKEYTVATSIRIVVVKVYDSRPACLQVADKLGIDQNTAIDEGKVITLSADEAQEAWTHNCRYRCGVNFPNETIHHNGAWQQLPGIDQANVVPEAVEAKETVSTGPGVRANEKNVHFARAALSASWADFEIELR
ncbi:MAG TPA: hypothetical protein VEK74_07640 [Burkholderiaceae bacterium]|nr:hypothetical protein [Burkholderiaceae bacterium]